MTAQYHLRIKIVSRTKGGRATAAAAYRAGERIRDRRMSAVDDFSDRTDVVYKEIVLPAEWDNCAEMSWARDRETLWNTAEFVNKRCDARVAREVLVMLPYELTPGQRVELVRGFSRELAEKYRGAVDAAIHLPRPSSDERHHHAHLLMTTREVTPQGLGRRTALEIMGDDRRDRGLEDYARDEYLWVRRGWARATNEALREAGLPYRVDCRSAKDQGIDREPTAHIPSALLYAERGSGKPTPGGDRIRAMYRERVEARLKGGDELARVLQKQQEQERQRLKEYAQRQALAPEKKAWSAMTRGERNAWRRQRNKALSARTPEERKEWRYERRPANPRRRARRARTREERNARRRERSRATREEYNRHRREKYKKNPAAVLEAQRAARKANPDQIRARERARRRANADRINARRRELKRAAGVEKKLRALKTRVLEQRAQPVKTPAASQESVVAWLEFRKQHPPEASADDSVANWKAFRERAAQQEPADDSIAAWRAFRAAQPQEKTADDSTAAWRAFRAAQPQEKTADDSIAAWKAFREREGPQATPQESIAKWREVRERELPAQEARADSNERSRRQEVAGRTDDDDEEDQRRKKIRSRDYGLEL
jgi:hypothetical protein